jgi:hypothetical protein
MMTCPTFALGRQGHVDQHSTQGAVMLKSFFRKFFADSLSQILGSKKAKAALVGVVLVLAQRWGLSAIIDEATATRIVTVVVGYMISQGIADFGKAAEIIRRIDAKS